MEANLNLTLTAPRNVPARKSSCRVIGHPESERNILDPAVEDTVKEFAAIDGAFIVSGDRVVLKAGSQLLPTAPPPQLASGLGTRHAAAAVITGSTDTLSNVVSKSTGTVTVFKSGEIIPDIHKRPS